MIFLTNQKDKKIQEMERTLAEMRQKLQRALQSTQYKKSTEIQKVFGKGKDVEELSAQFQLTGSLDQNYDPNLGQNQTQKEAVWAQELRRADERSEKFKADCESL